MGKIPFSKYIFIFAIVLMFIGSVFAGWKIRNNSKKLENPTILNQDLINDNSTRPKESSKSMIDIAMPETHGIDIPNLRTYKNEKYGFEFQYPKEIVFGDITEEKDSLYFDFCSNISCFREPDFFEIKNTEITDINELPDNFNYSDYCGGDLNDKGEPMIPGFIKDKKIVNSLDGKKGIVLHFNEDGYCTAIQFLNENKLFSFVIGNWKDERLDEVILSTFKFINKL